MGVLAGRLCTLGVGGVPTAMAAEACTDVGGAHTTYQITNDAKRAVDPKTAVTVFSNGVPVNAADYALDYVNGTITFPVARAGGEVITITGKYTPILDVVEVKSVEIVLPTPVKADVTRMNDTAMRTLEIAKKCELTVTHFTTPKTDLDPGGGTLLLETLLANDLIFVKAAVSNAQTLRGWFEPSATWQHTLNEALQGTLRLVGRSQECVGRPATDQALFSLT